MSPDDAKAHKKFALESAGERGLLDLEMLFEARMIDGEHQAVCPLCLQPISAVGFYSRLPQAEGREVVDLTVTEINLSRCQTSDLVRPLRTHAR